MFHDAMWALYFVDVLSHIRSVAGNLPVALLFLSFLLAGGCLILSDGPEDYARRLHKFLWNSIAKTVFALALGLYVFSWAIPEKQTMYLMLGVKASGEIINSETGQKVQKVINAKLDEYLEELTSNKKESK